MKLREYCLKRTGQALNASDISCAMFDYATSVEHMKAANRWRRWADIFSRLRR
jgi:hypothetical protein